MAAATTKLPIPNLSINKSNRNTITTSTKLLLHFPPIPYSPHSLLSANPTNLFRIRASLPPPSGRVNYGASTKLYVSGLSFRTTEEGLRNAFQNFGRLVEVNLVMDKIANRPRGFAFLRYGTEEESKKAIEGMHGKFLDGRVIFVEVAKPRAELRQGQNQNSRPYG